MSSRRPVATTSAPPSASPRAILLPSPEVPPTTTATRPLRSIKFLAKLAPAMYAPKPYTRDPSPSTLGANGRMLLDPKQVFQQLILAVDQHGIVRPRARPVAQDAG